jgi:hypothetical protein
VRLIEVPAEVAYVAAAALETRQERGGGGTARGVVLATALTTGAVRPTELVEIRTWHDRNPDACTGNASTLLGGMYGGYAGRAWVDGIEIPLYHGPAPLTAAPSLPIDEKLRRLSDKVNAIDRTTALRLHSAANVALEEAIRQAKVKIGVRGKRNAKTAAALDIAGDSITPALLAAVGVTEQELLDRRFDVFGATALTWLTAAQLRKLRAAARAMGLDPEPIEEEYHDRIEHRAAIAAGFLVAALGVLARSVLSGHGIVPEDQKGEFAGPVPFGVIRQAHDIADRGATPPTIDESGPGPAPVDDLAQRAVNAGKSLVEGIIGDQIGETYLIRTWRHGEPLRPFKPHDDLDGQSWIDADHGGILDADPQEWPYVEEYEPGDHDGCTCWIDSTYTTIAPTSAEAPE